MGPIILFIASFFLDPEYRELLSVGSFFVGFALIIQKLVSKYYFLDILKDAENLLFTASTGKEKSVRTGRSKQVKERKRKRRA